MMHIRITLILIQQSQLMGSRQALSVILVSFLLIISHAQQQASTGFGSHQIVLFEAAKNMTHPATNYTAALPKTYISITKNALTLQGFKMQSDKNVAFSTTLAMAGSTFTIGFVPLSNTSFYYISFNLLITTSNTSQYLELQSKCRACNRLNNPNRPQTIQNFTATSLVFGNLTNSHKVYVWLSYFNILNCVAQPNILIGLTNTIINTNTINLYLSSNNASKNTVVSVCFAFLIQDISKTTRQKYYFASFLQWNDGFNPPALLTALNLTFQVPIVFAPLSTNCSLGISTLSISQISRVRQIFFDFRTSSVSSVSVNLDVQHLISYSAFCLVDCSFTAFFNSISSNCVFCSGFPATLPNCYTCNSSSICTTCINTTYYTQSPAYICTLCNSTTKCQTCLNTTFCYTCINTFYAINSTHGCSTCNQLIQNCLQCTASNYCFQCLNNYYALNQTNGCSLCNRTLANCLTCSDNYTCEICNSNRFYLEPVGATCVPCTYHNLFFQCQNCDLNTTECLICKQYFFLNTSKKCQCQRGWYIPDGCTTVIGCTYAVPDARGFHCTQCDPSEYTLTILKTCACNNGLAMITQICSNVTGCLSMARINGTKTCVFCHLEQHFILVNNLCICTSGYYLSPLNKCQTVCGDGIVLDLPCDDGNLLNGDGCTDKCQIQPFYICNNSALLLPSHCDYIGSFTLDLIKISRSSSSNAGIFLFEIYPKIMNLNKINFLNSTTLSVNQNSDYNVTSATQTNGFLQLDVSFSKDLQSLRANLTIELPQDYFITKNMSLTFQINSNDSPLIIYSSFQLIVTLSSIGYYLNFAIVALFFLGSFSHKMIGVETIQIFMVVYYFASIGRSHSTFFTVFSQLSLLNANNNIFYNQSISLRLNNQSFVNQINHQYISNYYLIAVVIIILSFIFSIVYLIRVYREKQIFKKNKKEINHITKINYFLVRTYRNLIFPIVASWSIFQFLSLYTNNIRLVDNYIGNGFYESPESLYFSKKMNAIVSLFSFILSVVIFFNEMKVVIIRKNNIDEYLSMKKCSKTYISYYLIYITLLINSYLLQFYLSQFIAIIVIDCLLIVYTVLLLIYRPYANKLHNFSIIFNQFTLIIYFSWISFLQFGVNISDGMQNIFCAGVLGLLIIICLICLIRIFYQNCYGNDSVKQYLKMCQKFKVDDELEVDADEVKQFSRVKNGLKQYTQNVRKISENIILDNKYRIQTQIEESLLEQMKYFNQQRAQNSLSPVYYRCFDDSQKQQLSKTNHQIKGNYREEITKRSRQKQLMKPKLTLLLQQRKEREKQEVSHHLQKQNDRLEDIKSRLRLDLQNKQRAIFNASKVKFYQE